MLAPPLQRGNDNSILMKAQHAIGLMQADVKKVMLYSESISPTRL